MKRGPKPKSQEERTRFKSIAVDPGIVALLSAAADKLEAQFGFRPTLSQALRHLLKKVKP